MGDQSLTVINKNAKLILDGDGNFALTSLNSSIQGYNYLNIESYNDTEYHNYQGNLSIYNESGNVLIYTNANINPSMYITAHNINSNNGGLIIDTGSGGMKSNSLGNIILDSDGSNIMIGGDNTKNIIINVDDSIDMNTQNFNLVAQDNINIFSITGNINIGSDPNNPIISFEDGNLLVNQKNSIFDRQVDINISDSSSYKSNYNGILVSSNIASVASDLEFRTSNCGIFSLGIQPTNSNLAIYQNYLAYQNNTSIIPINCNGLEFTKNDIGKNIHWHTTNRDDIILDLSSNIVGNSDSSNLTILGTYIGITSNLYLLEIDSIANGINSTKDTFKWSDNGGISFDNINTFIPCSNTTPIILNNGISVQFSLNTGYNIKQQFVFYSKITAIVSNSTSIANPENLSTLQPQYSYIKTITPNDIVISTNNAEKMRITGDGAIGIQTNHPLAGVHISSKYGSTNIVNQQISGYQINPHITSLISGGYIITWASKNQNDNTFDIVAQQYETDGSTYGNNFTIASNASGSQIFPAVANSRTTGNTFMCVWSSNSGGSEYDVFGRIFQNTTPITNDILLNSTELNNQLYPRITGIANGNFVATWSNANNHTGNIYAVIINTSGTIVTTISPVNNIHTYSINYPWVSGLSKSDPYFPGGFVISYLKELSTSDDRYKLAFKVFSYDAASYGTEVNISTNSVINSISDGLQTMDYIPDGGFVLSYYQNYNSNSSYYNEGDNVLASSSNVYCILGNVSVSTSNVIPVINYSGKFVIGEEITIDSSVFGAGNITEKIANVVYNTSNTANITLDNGHKCVRTLRFESNATNSNNATFNQIVSTTQLYPDIDRQNAIIDPGSIYSYQRPMSSISVDSNNTALISWTNGSIPNIYYQLINIFTGTKIFNETALQQNGLKQRNPMVSYLTSIAGDDYGYTITWDNQNLDLSESGIYNKIVGYKHDITRMEDMDNILVWNHQGHLGVGLKNPNCSIHITELEEQNAILKIQSNSTSISPIDRFINITATNNYPVEISSSNPQYRIDPRYKKTGIIFSDGNDNTLAQIIGGYSCNYQSLTPDVFTLRGYFNMDEIDQLVLNNIAPGNTDGTYYSKFILQNCDSEYVRVPGIINSGIMFNGVNNYALYSPSNYIALNTMSSENSNLSINIWINIPSIVEINSHYTIITNGTDFNSSGCHYELSIIDISSNGSMYLYSVITSNSSQSTTLTHVETAINDNTWHNIGFTLGKTNGSLGNGNVNLYLDGIIVETALLLGPFDSSSWVNNNNVYLGTSNGSTNFYRGYLDELRIYNKELSTNEISVLYNYGNIKGGNIDIGIKPLSDDGIIYKNVLTLDDTGSLLNINAKPRNAHTIQNVIYTSSSNSNITTNKPFQPAFNIGDILQINNSFGLADYTILDLPSNTNAILDRPSYNGIGPSGSYYIPLCLPTIQKWSNEDDIHKASIDYYGRMIIGNSGHPNSLLELIGEKTYPYLTLTNNSISNALYDRKTGIIFRGNDGSSYKNLGKIEVSHGTSADDNNGIMIISMNNTSNEYISINSNGYMGVGGQNAPLTRLHIQEFNPDIPSQLLLASKYLNYPAIPSAVFHEASEIYFAGQQSLTETNSLTSNTLVKIVGSNDGWENKPDGRLDFYTNNSINHSSELYLEKRMSITKNGYIGIDIPQPTNILEVSPHIGNYHITANNTSPNLGNTTVILDHNSFAGWSDGDKMRMIGGSFVVNDRYLSNYPITNISGVNSLIVSGNIASGSITSNIITIHYPGLNVMSNGYIGLGTTTPVSATQMNGSVSHTIKSINSTLYTLDNSDYTIIANTISTAITITLPNATLCYGRIYIIKRNGSNIVTIDTIASQTIDEASTYSITSDKNVARLQSDGNQWWII